MLLRTTFTCALLCGVTLFVSGCASTQTRADMMRGYANDTQAEADMKRRLATDWDRGQALIVSGNQKIADAEKMLDAGKRELSDGRRLVRDSEREFNETYPNSPFSK